jgi:hypothetical protein
VITFNTLLAESRRRALFEKYGVWTQFDRLYDGFFTGPSYGHGYATQTMLLLDRMQMASKALDFLARVTYEPFPANVLDRESPYFFYERIYLPELLEDWKDPDARRRQGAPEWIINAFDGQRFDQGCGALNLVNVAEPLKIARLIAGVDNPNPFSLKLIPRIPPAWTGLEVADWPVITLSGPARIDFHARRSPGFLLEAGIEISRPLEKIEMRVGPFPAQTTALEVLVNGVPSRVPAFVSGDSAWGWLALPPGMNIQVSASPAV